MITFLQALTEANDEIKEIRTLSFANIKEFNSFVESFSFDDYPVNVIVPFTNNGSWVGGLRKGMIPLQGWMLTKIDADTEDFRSVQIEHAYLEPMRSLAMRFLSALLETDVIDPEVNSVSDSIKPEYAFLAQRLFGVSYTMNVPVYEHVC